MGFVVHLVRDLVDPAKIGATDFTVFRTGWWLVLHDAGRLYDAGAQAAVERAIMNGAGVTGFTGGFMAFLYPPHAALAGAGLGWVAEHAGGPTAFWLWTACNVALLVRLVQLVRDELGISARGTLLVALTLCGFPPVFETLRQGQVSLLLGVAALSLVIAAREHRPRTAAAWLVVLSIKPQTLPVLLVVLAARRERRVLAFAAAFGGVAALGAALVLGPRVWMEFALHVRELERFFGAGTPAYMPSLRGLLTRIMGDGCRAVDQLSLAGWLLAIAASGVAAARRRRAGLDDARIDFSFAFAAGLLASPHLFPQDVVLWVVPATLILASLRFGGRSWRRAVWLTLAVPFFFVLSGLIAGDARPPRLPADLTMIPMLVALVWTSRSSWDLEAGQT